MLTKFFIQTIFLCFCIYITAAVASAETIKLNIIHPNWNEGKGMLQVDKQDIAMRVGSHDKGKFKMLDDDTFQINWDSYAPEFFKKFGKWYVKYDKASIDVLKKEYARLAYDFQNPYVKINPFGTNPLSAYVRFETADFKTVQVTVKGKDGTPDLIFRPTGLSKNHELCVPGLYPGQENHIELTACTKEDVCETSFLNVPTFKVPNHPNLRLSFFTKTKMTKQPFMIFLIRDAAVAYDENAYMRWMLDTNRFVYPFPDFFAVEANNIGIMLYSPCGQLLNVLAFPYDFENFAHGVAYGKNKSLLVIGSRTNQEFNLDGKKLKTAYDHILEMDLNGSVFRYLDLGKVMPMNHFRVVKSFNPFLDALHLNHVTYMPHDNSLTISSKHNGFFKIDNESLQVKWIAGPHPTSKMLNRQGDELDLPYLTAVDENGIPYPEDVQNGINKEHLFDWPIVAHDGKPSGSFYTVFSNNGPVYDPTLTTRKFSTVLIYRIDENKKTINEAARILLPEFAPIASNATFDEKTGILHIFVSDVDDKNVQNQVYNKIYRLRLPPLKHGDKVQIFDVAGNLCAASEKCTKPEILFEGFITGRTYFYQGREHDLSQMPITVNLNK